MTKERARFQKMSRLATGLLVVMACAYFLSRSLEEGASAWAWVRAFSEAAMVGALADWFAVTALFRHPLGLPIPHTAIVRKEKQRVGELVGKFVAGSFLTKEEVSRQWKNWRPVNKFAHWLSDEDNAKKSVRRVAGWIPAFFERADGMDLSRVGAEKLRASLQGLPVGRLVAVLLQGFLRSPTRRQVLAPILGKLSETVTENRDWVIDEARKGAPMRGTKVLGAITEVATMMMSGKAVEKLSAELAAASGDEEHPLYEKIEDALGQTLSELDSGESNAWEAFKQRVLADPETQEVLEEVLRGAGRYLLVEAQSMEAGSKYGNWGAMLSNAASRLTNDQEQLEHLENVVEKAVAGFFERYGEGFEAVIALGLLIW